MMLLKDHRDDKTRTHTQNVYKRAFCFILYENKWQSIFFQSIFSCHGQTDEMNDITLVTMVMAQISQSDRIVLSALGIIIDKSFQINDVQNLSMLSIFFFRSSHTITLHFQTSAP